MKKRGAKFWLWSDCQLQSTLRRVTADCGIQIELQARSSRKSIIQLFVGVYDGRGLPLVEEYYAHCPEESVTQALEWGQKRAHFLTECKQQAAKQDMAHQLARCLQRCAGQVTD